MATRWGYGSLSKSGGRPLEADLVSLWMITEG